MEEPRPRDTSPPKQSPREPGGLGPSKQPPGVSQNMPKHPAPNTENHKYTSGQRHQRLGESVQGPIPQRGKQLPAQEVVPFIPGWRQTERPSISPNLNDPGPDPNPRSDPSPQQPVSPSGEGATEKEGPKEPVPTP
ncbi:hypothetical protein CRENBAI_020612 [Crenichthys baileyi]|uniref:Uncharacterized protein n=1 Tax=Crenichthys baileyi TaxID=28760 RepID=A0AAV9RUG4_9TELE